MDKIIEKEKIGIDDMIYEINGTEVMLDSDLAKLYHVETKRINEAVKNNPNKFPTRFSWMLDKEEYNNLRSKISTLENNTTGRGKYSKYLPRVFTEQGVYMLATILKSDVATAVSIAIMDAFVKMRHYINYNKNLLPNRILLLENKVDENTQKINELFDKFDCKEITKEFVFFENDFYDAYSTVMDIFNMSRKEIIIIDNYASKELLDILRDINKEIIIVSENIDEKLKMKYEKQYKNVTFIKDDSFHDRYIILDRYRLYSCGSSLKDIGKKCFSIHEFRDIKHLDIILDKLKLDTK